MKLFSIALLAGLLPYYLTPQVKPDNFTVRLATSIGDGDVSEHRQRELAQLKADFTSLLFKELSKIQELDIVSGKAPYTLLVTLQRVPEDCDCDYAYFSAEFSTTSALPYFTGYGQRFYFGFTHLSQIQNLAEQIVSIFDRSQLEELRSTRKYPHRGK